jgi:hypothetical protein
MKGMDFARLIPCKEEGVAAKGVTGADTEPEQIF